MFALIKREIEDNIVFFLITAIFMTMLVSRLVYRVAIGLGGSQAFSVPSSMYKIFGFFPITFLIATAFGASQMNLDRDKKISGFLATLATTRRRILSAKIITGVLWILLVVLPIAVADAVLLKVFPKAVIPDADFLRNVFITVFLCSLTCYAFGLQIGWRSGKLWPALGVIFVTPILVSLLVIKGIGFETMIILSLFITAAMVRTWQKFMSTSL